MKPAIVIIDMQKDFFRFKEERLASNQTVLVNNINSLTEEARKNDIPVIWIRQVLKADLSDSPKGIKKSGKGVVLEGTAGCELLNGLIVEDSDKEVIKTRYSGFFKTNLEKLIEELDVDTLIVAGINTHACVRMTVIDAYQRDIDVIIAEDCVDSWDEEHHRVSMKYFEPIIAKIMPCSDLITLFKN